MAAWTFFPIATGMMIKAGKSITIMAPWWISDENLVMILPRSRRFCLMLLLPAVWNWIKITVNGFHGKLDAAVCFVHLEVAVLADGHSSYSLSLPLFSCGISEPLLSVSSPLWA